LSNSPRLPIDALLLRLPFKDLSPTYLRQAIENARREDLEGLGLAEEPLDTGDVSSALLAGEGDGSATLNAREDLVICGLPLVPFVLSAYHPKLTVKPLVEDGTRLSRGQAIATISGPANELLQAERVLLNFLQYLSGIAFQTRIYVDALGDSPTRLLDTRKTTPGYRMLQKYAVACGGAWNHRLGLWDRVMLKDNHLAGSDSANGSALTELVLKAREQNPKLPIEVEVDRIDQISPVLEAGADIIMLDNFSREQLSEAVRLIDGQAYTEASGGITLDTLPQLGNLGLDFISTGALVHKATWKDIGLDWD